MSHQNKAMHLYTIICQYPGRRPSEIARIARVDRFRIYDRLASLDKFGLLIWEDEDRCLWPFEVPQGQHEQN